MAVTRTVRIERISAFEDFCERFDAELVTVHTNAYRYSDADAKREERRTAPGG